MLNPTKIKTRFPFDFPEELPTCSCMNICSILDQEFNQVHVPSLNGNVECSLAYRDRKKSSTFNTNREQHNSFSFTLDGGTESSVDLQNCRIKQKKMAQTANGSPWNLLLNHSVTKGGILHLSNKTDLA